MKRLLLLTLCLFSLTAAAASGATLTGVVRDAGTSAPLAGALVKVLQTGDSTFTNGIGAYSFPSISNGTYTLLVGKSNYQPAILINVVVGICCVGLRGNVDCTPTDVVDIADLTTLVDHLFLTNSPLCCPAEGNVDGTPNGQVDIADLLYLVDYLFISNVPPPACQ